MHTRDWPKWGHARRVLKCARAAKHRRTRVPGRGRHRWQRTGPLAPDHGHSRAMAVHRPPLGRPSATRNQTRRRRQDDDDERRRGRRWGRASAHSKGACYQSSPGGTDDYTVDPTGQEHSSVVVSASPRLQVGTKLLGALVERICNQSRGYVCRSTAASRLARSSLWPVCFNREWKRL